ncbi:unnamed protein product, partial [marine sediment metagenome]
MSSDVSMVTGQQILFNLSASYVPTVLGDLELGTATDVEMDLTSVQSGEAEESTKGDLTATWAPAYAVHAAFEFATAPVTGETVDVYWAPSVNSAAAEGNPGYVVGAPGAYAGGVATLAEGLKQLMFIGSLVCSTDATATVQMAFIATFAPPTRYGTLVVHNNTSDHFHNDAVEMGVSFTPI